MSVFPAASGQFLPPTWRELMSSPVSELFTLLLPLDSFPNKKISFLCLSDNQRSTLLMRLFLNKQDECFSSQYSRIFWNDFLIRFLGIINHRFLSRKLCHRFKWEEICMARYSCLYSVIVLDWQVKCYLYIYDIFRINYTHQYISRLLIDKVLCLDKVLHFTKHCAVNPMAHNTKQYVFSVCNFNAIR